MSDWISVDDKLPRVRKSGFSNYVLTYSGGSLFMSARLRDGQWRTPMEQKVGVVTHWMPLPEPPK